MGGGRWAVRGVGFRDDKCMDGVLDHAVTEIEEEVGVIFDREEFSTCIDGGEGEEGDGHSSEVRGV